MPTIILRLPAPERVVRAEGAPKPATSRGGTETLLVCDDDPGIVRMMASALRRVGYVVLEAQGPREAIEIFHEQDGRVDLLVTDVMMPELTGEDLLAQLRMGRPELQAVLLTGYTPDGLEARGVALDGGRLLQKPFSPEDLRATVREVLDAVPDVRVS